MTVATGSVLDLKNQKRAIRNPGIHISNWFKDKKQSIFHFYWLQMQNVTDWNPSKYEYHKGKLRGSRNKQELSVSSRLLADIVATFYDKHLKDHARGRLIDLGCGKVPLYHAYRNLVESVTCVDWGNTFHKNSHLDIQCSLNEKLPIADESFDTIILSDVLEHIAEPKLLFHEMNRILSPGGKLLMNVPFYYRIHEAPFDYFRYTSSALEYFCQIAGFKLIKLEPLGGFPEVLNDICSKYIAYKPVIGKPSVFIIDLLYKLFITTGFGKTISKKSSATFPYGYFLVSQK